MKQGKNHNHKLQNMKITFQILRNSGVKKKDVERWPKQKNKKPPQTSNLGQATDSEKYISPESSFQQSFDYSDEV